MMAVVAVAWRVAVAACDGEWCGGSYRSDRDEGNVFGVRRKSSPEKFFGGGRGRRVVASGRRSATPPPITPPQPPPATTKGAFVFLENSTGCVWLVLTATGGVRLGGSHHHSVRLGGSHHQGCVCFSVATTEHLVLL
uniref:Secreted protein n=1 Tax=Tanacetum cinerariifolium TaxID=118510 RepID=A0A699QEA1_TANCI|nr:hypothetical protein [Tanacetum cinerariifolium]